MEAWEPEERCVSVTALLKKWVVQGSVLVSKRVRFSEVRSSAPARTPLNINVASEDPTSQGPRPSSPRPSLGGSVRESLAFQGLEQS